MNNRRRRIAKARRLIKRLHVQGYSTSNPRARQRIIGRLRMIVRHVDTVR